jgi:hypothetical protein
MRCLAVILRMLYGTGFVFLAWAGDVDGTSCEKLHDYNSGVGPVINGFHLKDSCIQVSSDAYRSESRLIYKSGEICFDLGKEFSVSRLISASTYFRGLDFSRPNALEDFLDYYFEGLAHAGNRWLRPNLAYLKEDGIQGDHLILVAVPRDTVLDNRWGSYEVFVYTRLECLSVDKSGRFWRGDPAKCRNAVKEHGKLSRTGQKP